MAEQGKSYGRQVDPFGVQPKPWYRQASKGLPRPVAGALGLFFSGLAGAAMDGHHGLSRLLVGSAVLVVPPALLDAWWQERRRRREDVLMPELTTESRPTPSRIGPCTSLARALFEPVERR